MATPDPSLSTAFTRAVGVDAPIVQAPIGGLATPELAAAVAEAGALGMLAATWTDVDVLPAVIARTTSLTSRPFGVNLILEWDQSERVAVVLEAGVKVVSFFWGDPSRHIEPCHEAGALVMMSVGTVDEARRAVDAGVDFVVAQGWEAGGHVRGEVSTLALVPAVVDAVSPVPVVAAGGIADGRGLAAVLTLGASAAWMGTRFVLASEARPHPVYRDRLLRADGSETIHSTLFDGAWPDAPHRTLRNSTVEAWLRAGRPTTGSRPDEGEIIARIDGDEIRRYDSASPREGVDGEVEAMSLWAGQSVGLIGSVEPAATIVKRTVAEAREILDRGTRER